MGPTKENPTSGSFIVNQFDNLKSNPELDVDFFYIQKSKNNRLKRLVRYPYFFLQFVFNYIFSLKKIDIIHVHFYFPCIIFAIIYKLIRNWKVKIVVTFHGSDIYLYRRPNILYRLSSYCVDKYIFVSYELKKQFYREVDGVVLSAGILDIFKTNKLTEVPVYDLIFVGHLNENKGIDRLLQILSKTEMILSIVIVGKGKYYKEQLDQALILNKHNITYYEDLNQPKLAELYNKSKLLINLSRKESFGLVMTEAMACGLPVIATETDGSMTQVIDSVNGYIISNSEDQFLDEAISVINKSINMPESKYTLLSKEAIKSSDAYRVSNVTVALSKIYQNLTKSKN